MQLFCNVLLSVETAYDFLNSSYSSSIFSILKKGRRKDGSEKNIMNYFTGLVLILVIAHLNPIVEEAWSSSRKRRTEGLR